MAVLYILAGLNHFRQPDIYEKIIPPFIPYKKQINDIIGFLTIIFGVYIFIPVYTEHALWSIIFLLIVVFPSNIYMLVSKEAGLAIPKWILLLRIPIQFLLIYWAYQYIPFKINYL